MLTMLVTQTSASFVTLGDHSTSSHLAAPIAPKYQPIGELTQQYRQFCA